LIFLSILAVSSFVSATEAPLVGRPREHFYNAVGQHVRVELSATPTDVRVEDELTLAIQISGAVKPEQIERPDLRSLDEFASRFHIDDLDEGGPKESPNGVRTFRYRLRPKNERVGAIPPLLVRYYDPKLDYFPTTVSNSIPLHVRPRIAPESTGMPMQEPAFLFHIAEGPDALTRQSPRSGWPEMILAFFGPALLCIGWYSWWRYRHPDEAKLAHLRRSRAVRHALDQLRGLHESSAVRLADASARIMRAYLHERWDMPASDSTPAEIDAHLRRRSMPAELIESARAFFHRCDEVRFGPPSDSALDLQESAKSLLVSLEDAAAVAESAAQNLRLQGLGKAGLGLVAIVSSFSAVLAVTVSDQENVERAESSFRAGTANRDNDVKARPLFRQAAEGFAELRRLGATSPELHRSEGNARLLSGDLPEAIAAYRRGLHLNPDDAQLQQALDYARSRIEFSSADDRAALSAREESLHWVRSTLRQRGIWLIAILSTAGWAAVVRWRVTREGTWAWTGGVLLALTALTIAGRVEEFRDRQADEQKPFAVVRQASILRKGNGPSFAPRRDNPLSAGVEVTIRQERGDWVQVELADGSLGWLPQEAVARF
jgi:hypothetical protein